MKLGIIGLEQSGKTTVFNALTGADKEVGSFGKIEAHLSVVKVPDERLDANAADLADDVLGVEDRGDLVDVRDVGLDLLHERLQLLQCAGREEVLRLQQHVDELVGAELVFVGIVALEIGIVR